MLLGGGGTVGVLVEGGRGELEGGVLVSSTLAVTQPIGEILRELGEVEWRGIGWLALRGEVGGWLGVMGVVIGVGDRV